MSLSALPIYKYQFDFVIDLIFFNYYGLSPIDWTIWRNWWMLEYGIERIEIEGVSVYATQKTWAFILDEVSGDPSYAVGVQCPCRNRDGYNQPFPVCPE